MKTTEEPTSSLGQTLEWLRKELVRLCTSLYLTPSPHVFRGPLFLPPMCPLGGAELQAGCGPHRLPSGMSHTVHCCHPRRWDK